jgi:hypothetical protein
LGDPYADLDDLVREIDRALQVLKKIRSAQVRNAEHRDFFRATTLSWFHTRRSDVAQDMGAEIPEQIDFAEHVARDRTGLRCRCMFAPEALVDLLA